MAENKRVRNWFLGMEKWLWWFRPGVHPAWRCLLQLLEMCEWGEATTGQSGRNPLPAIFFHLQPLQLSPLHPVGCMSHPKSIFKCLSRFPWTFITWYCSQYFGRDFWPCLCSLEPGSIPGCCDGGGQTAPPCPSPCAARGFLDWITAVPRSSIFRLKTQSFHYFFIREVMLDFCHPLTFPLLICVYMYI